LTSGLSLDFERFGSHWLAHNQLSNTFFLRGVCRFSGGSRLELRASQSGIEETERRQSFEEALAPYRVGTGRDDSASSSADPFACALGLFTASQEEVCLALSGGIDSRLLLALAVSSGKKNVRAVTYVSSGKSDASLALRLAEAVGIPCRAIEDVPLPEAIANGTASAFARENMCISPLSACAHLTHYERVYRDDPRRTVIDGALGELGRARFYRGVEVYRRLTARGFRRRSRASDRFTAGAMKALSFHRANVFNEEAVRLMRVGFKTDTEAFVADLRGARVRRPEDWMGLRYRRANFFGYAQSWLDRFGFNAMPLGQQPVAGAILDIPIRRRRGGALYRETIHRLAPDLARFPLAKGGMQYPFAMPDVFVPVYSALGRVRGRDTSAQASAWISEREFVGDLLHSSETRSFGAYDCGKLDELFAACFDRDVGRFGELDWWLSFELWRREHGLV
jgi:hypothetical protein